MQAPAGITKQVSSEPVDTSIGYGKPSPLIIGLDALDELVDIFRP